MTAGIQRVKIRNKGPCRAYTSSSFGFDSQFLFAVFICSLGFNLLLDKMRDCRLTIFWHLSDKIKIKPLKKITYWWNVWKYNSLFFFFLFSFFLAVPVSFQSLVLISQLPYVTFFHSLLKIMAPEYFEKQEPCLEAGQFDYLSVCNHLCNPVSAPCGPEELTTQSLVHTFTVLSHPSYI